MRIIYIIKDISVVGGRERIVIEKAKSLAENGFVVTIISFHIKNYAINDISELKKNNVELIDLCIPEDLSNSLLGLNRIKLFFLLRKKINLFLTSHRPDFIISLIESCFSVVFFVNAKCFKIAEVHGCYDYYSDFGDVQNMILLLKSIKKRCKLFLLKFILSKFDKVVFLSKVDFAKWKLSNGIVIPNFYYGEKPDLQKIVSGKRFISAGRLSYEKGFDILLDVWKLVHEKNSNIKIDIYGDGPEKNNLISKIKNYGLENVVKIFNFEDNVYKKFPSYYFYILPSRFEAFPMVVLESLNNGTPVISFSLNCGLKDMIIDGENGILIKKYDVEDMSKHIVMVFENPNIRNEMSEKSLRMNSSFSKNKIISKWKSFFYEFKT